MYRVPTLLESALLIAVCLTFTSNVSAEMTSANSDVMWYTDADAGWKDAQNLGRDLILFFTMDGCPACNKMKSTTFSDEAVQDVIRDGFVPVTVTRDAAGPLAKKLGIRAYPTTLLIRVNREQIRVADNVQGFIQPQEFSARLQRVRR